MGRLGQSTVEYLLLLSVIITIAYSVFRSDIFKRFFGEENFKGFVLIMEQGYRHGSVPADANGTINASLISGDNTGARGDYGSDASTRPEHPTYFKASKTHFFGPQNKYPE